MAQNSASMSDQNMIREALLLEQSLCELINRAVASAQKPDLHRDLLICLNEIHAAIHLLHQTASRQGWSGAEPANPQRLMQLYQIYIGLYNQSPFNPTSSQGKSQQSSQPSSSDQNTANQPSKQNVQAKDSPKGNTANKKRARYKQKGPDQNQNQGQEQSSGNQSPYGNGQNFIQQYAQLGSTNSLNNTASALPSPFISPGGFGSPQYPGMYNFNPTQNQQFQQSPQGIPQTNMNQQGSQGGQTFQPQGISNQMGQISFQNSPGQMMQNQYQSSQNGGQTNGQEQKGNDSGSTYPQSFRYPME